MKYKVDIEIGGVLHAIAIDDVQSPSEVVESVWATYGYSTQIHRIYQDGEVITDEDSSIRNNGN